MRARSLRATHFNKTAHPLPPLAIGDQVVIQNSMTKRWSTPGVVVEIGPFRDFLIKTPAGWLYRRNRRFLRRFYTSIARPQHPDSPVPPPASTTSPVQSPMSSAARTPVPPRRSAQIRRSSRKFNSSHFLHAIVYHVSLYLPVVSQFSDPPNQKFSIKKKEKGHGMTWQQGPSPL
jgi:hypothetical protein